MSDSFLSRISPPKPERPASTGPLTVPNDAYTAAAFKAEIQNVENAPEGTRNHQLFASTCALAEFCNSGTLSEDAVRQAMTDAGRTAGLDDLEIERTIQSAFDKTQGIARMIPAASVPAAEKVAENTPSVREAALSSRLLTPSAMRELPAPTPLIENVLDCGTTAMLYANWGSGKSFVALDWAACVATGKRWQGRYTEQKRVLYVIAEGAYGFSKRIQAWEAAWKTPLKDDQIAFLPVPVNLMSSDVDRLVEDVAAGGFGLVVLDTLARCTVGADENSSQDAGIIVDAMTRVVNATPERRGVVLCCHHTGKNGQTSRGSSAFEAGMDSVYFLEKSGSTLNLECKKRKDGPDSDRHTLMLQSSGDSCIVQAISGEQRATDGAEAVSLLKRIFSEMFASGGVGHSDLKTVAAEHGMSSSVLYRAKEQLIREGWISVSPGARPHYEMSEHAKAWMTKRTP